MSCYCKLDKHTMKVADHHKPKSLFPKQEHLTKHVRRLKIHP